MEKGNGLEAELGDTQSSHKPTEVVTPNKKQHWSMLPTDCKNINADHIPRGNWTQLETDKKSNVSSDADVFF